MKLLIWQLCETSSNLCYENNKYGMGTSVEKTSAMNELLEEVIIWYQRI